MIRPLVALVLLALTPCIAQVPKPPSAGGTSTKPATKSAESSPPGEESADTTFKVDVKLVNVFVTVTDDHGAPVAGLNKDDFTLLENDNPQRIAVFGKESALPLSIVLQVDTSLSTRRNLPLELSSARRFARAILRPIDGMSVYAFSETVNEITPFTSDTKVIDRGIDRIRLGSATALYDALYLGSHALESRTGRKVMVVITDGGDTVSSVNYKEAVRAAQIAEAIVYSIILFPSKPAPAATPAASTL